MNSEESICNELIDALNGWSWKWDDRFGSVLTEFSVAEQTRVRDVLKRVFRDEWSSANIGAAPDVVRAVKEHCGGLMPGQILFTPDTGQGDFVFGAWWPWGNGRTISLRIAPFSTQSPGADRIDQFKARFGL